MKMRTTTPYTLISLYFFLQFSFFTHSSLPAQERATCSTVDDGGASANDLVLIGVEYYIKLATTTYDVGRGLTVHTVGNETCPVSVLQDCISMYGLPVTFHPVNPEDPVVYLSTDLNIKFEATVPCAESTVWKVDGKHEYVTIGGELGKAGCETTQSWFRIEKFGVFYKIVYCPSVCDSGEIVCKDVGTLAQGGFKRLVLTDGAPFTFVLVKKPYLTLPQ